MMRSMKVPFLAAVRNSSPRTVATASKAGAFVLGAVFLFGCPIYSGGSNGNGGSPGGGDVISCDSQGVCCDETTGQCSASSCSTNTDCPTGASCTSGGFCVSGVYDGGGYYDTGSSGCTAGSCPSGYTCTLTNRISQCLPTPDGGSGGDATTDGGDGGGNKGDGGSEASSSDASDAQVLPPFTGCTTNAACTADGGSGALCIDGQCVSAANQCFDSTQCPYLGTVQELCVAGVCTPSCAAGATCPAGYSCDPGGSGACTVNSAPCGATEGGAACAAGTTCVENHCVPSCTTSSAEAGPDAGASSCNETGLVCVDYGCIPDQAATFFCSTEGKQDNCASGSICLHHACYISCNPTDGGTGDAGNICQHADNFNECKPVQTSTGTYDVCGSSSNLGNQCGPTAPAGTTCTSGKICIDGFCH